MIYDRLDINKDDYNSLKSKLSNILISIHNQFNGGSHVSEDAYFISFFACLSREKIKVGEKFIEFKTSKINDRGKNSAESIGGCDLGIVFDWVNDDRVIFNKGVIGQAKNNTELSADKRKTLKIQCDKMRKFTKYSIVLFREKNQPPGIIMATDIKDDMDINKHYADNKISLCDFIIDKVLACYFGDTDKDKIDKMKRSDLGIELIVKTNLKPQPEPKPQPESKPKPKPKF